LLPKRALFVLLDNSVDLVNDGLSGVENAAHRGKQLPVSAQVCYGVRAVWEDV